MLTYDTGKQETRTRKDTAIYQGFYIIKIIVIFAAPPPCYHVHIILLSRSENNKRYTVSKADLNLPSFG